MRLLVAAALLTACADPEWNPEDEAQGTFVGVVQPPCGCYGGPPFEIRCTGGSEPDANLVVPFYETPPNQRHFTPVNVDRRGYRGFGDGIGWYSSTLIGDPRGTGKVYRWIGLDHASAMPQQLCTEEGSDCQTGYQGFTLDSVRVLCEVSQ